MDIFFTSLAFAGGYAASIYTWPWIRAKVTGARAEIANLEAKAAALKAAL